MDYGSIAPTSIFVEAFKQGFDFDISLEEARGPMEMGKWDHIHTLLNTASIRVRWQNQFGRLPTKEDVDQIYNTFMPLQQAKVADRASPIEGVLPVIHRLQSDNVKIGSCSGYPKPVMDVLVSAAAEYGYKPELDVVIIEKDLCGQGASGRNGGAMLTWSTKFCSLIKQVGLERAMFLVKASEQAVHDIKAFTEKYGLTVIVELMERFIRHRTPHSKMSLNLCSIYLKHINSMHGKV